MRLNIYQIDAFADKVFSGNPAAVCPLDSWLSDEILQKIAMENNLSETASYELSERKGYLRCKYLNDRTEISGQGKLYLKGEIYLD